MKGRELTKGPVWPGSVVVPQVLGQYLVQVALIDDQQPAGTSRRRVPIIRSQMAFARGVAVVAAR